MKISPNKAMRTIMSQPGMLRRRMDAHRPHAEPHENRLFRRIVQAPVGCEPISLLVRWNPGACEDTISSLADVLCRWNDLGSTAPLPLARTLFVPTLQPTGPEPGTVPRSAAGLVGLHRHDPRRTTSLALGSSLTEQRLRTVDDAV